MAETTDVAVMVMRPPAERQNRVRFPAPAPSGKMIKIYNTLTRKKEEFVPLENKKVKMFVCGFTVYDYAHIGHGKSYIAFDVIVKYLRYKGYDVFYLQNVTDIDDRIIKRANELGISAKELAEKFTKSYLEDMKALNINSVNLYANATDYIPQIIEQIKGLIEKGFAYEVKDGVYYDVTKFPDYGKLSRMSKEEIKKHRVEPNPNKKNPEDFVLWKKQKPGEPAWDSPWGKGRPGWHIEDTAISIHHFGPQYDIHGGGEDLIFPHHEAEIAQAEAFTGKKPFVRYWMHNAFMLVNGEKMSKSKGNFYTIKDILKKYDPMVVRFALLNSNYRKPMNFVLENIGSAKESLDRLIDFLRKLKEIKSNENNPEVNKLIEKVKKKFEDSMNDDFNVPNAIASIFDFIRKINKLIDQNKVSKLNANSIIKQIMEFDKILSILEGWEREEEIPEEIKKLIKEREEARKKKDFETADKIREQIKKKGYKLEDTDEGTKCKKIS